MPESHPVRLFSSDLDGTLLGNPESTQRFKAAWEALDPAARPLLVYNSGRLVDDLRRFVDNGTLPAAAFYIGGVGTQVFDVEAGRSLDELHAHLAEGWNGPRVQELVSRFPGVQPQPAEFQHEFKSSWFLNRATPGTIRELKRQLQEAGLNVNVVYSSARDLDVLPRHATKSGALSPGCANDSACHSTPCWWPATPAMTRRCFVSPACGASSSKTPCPNSSRPRWT
jgi:hydroxymethylpyrimidine pyrophosphatase-like HAD family hydrolase